MTSTIGKLTVPLPLPQLNDVLNDAKRHWSFYSIKKKKETDRVTRLAEAARCRSVDRPVRMWFTWFTKDRRIDPDNLTHGVKYVLDGLVTAKVLSNDTRKWVKGLYHEFEVDKDNPRVEVAWKEEEETDERIA